MVIDHVELVAGAPRQVLGADVIVLIPRRNYQSLIGREQVLHHQSVLTPHLDRVAAVVQQFDPAPFCVMPGARVVRQEHQLNVGDAPLHQELRHLVIP